MLRFQKNGRVIFAGDLNARTKNEIDYILPDINGVQDFSKILPERNSEDKKDADNRGKELLETCKALNLVINNGRKSGDIYGKYISIQWRGCTVVDYVISDQALFQDISALRVGPYIPWLSDHCALHFFISCNKDISDNKGTKKDLELAPKQFLWGVDSRTKFLSALTSCEDELCEIDRLDTRDTENILSSFTNTVTTIARKAQLKYKSKKAKTKN